MIRKLLMVALVAMTITTAATAGWVDNWITQKTAGGPDYQVTESMGILTMGGFNARWNRGSGASPLMGFERISMRAGCGGIDVRLGGLWFAGIDQIVQKVQSIISNAGAIVFDLALKSISESLSNSFKWVDDITRAVNKYAVDDCQAARQLIAALDTSNPSAKAAAKAEEQKIGAAEKAAQLGATSDPSKASAESGDTNTLPVDEATIRADCPQVIQDMLPTGNGRLSLLDKMLTNIAMGTSTDSIRGMIGDVYIAKNSNKNGDTYVAQEVSGCYENKQIDLSQLIYGGLKKKLPDNTCTDDETPAKGVLDYVSTNLTSIATKLESDTPMTVAERAFFNELPQYFQLKIKTGAMKGAASLVANDLSEVAAEAYAYKMMNDMYMTVRKAALYYREGINNDQKKLEACKIGVVGDLDKKLGEWTKSMFKYSVALRERYVAQVQKYNLQARMNEMAYQEYIDKKQEVIEKIRAR